MKFVRIALCFIFICLLSSCVRISSCGEVVVDNFTASGGVNIDANDVDAWLVETFDAHTADRVSDFYFAKSDSKLALKSIVLGLGLSSNNDTPYELLVADTVLMHRVMPIEEWEALTMPDQNFRVTDITDCTFGKVDLSL